MTTDRELWQIIKVVGKVDKRFDLTTGHTLSTRYNIKLCEVLTENIVIGNRINSCKFLLQTFSLDLINMFFVCVELWILGYLNIGWEILSQEFLCAIMYISNIC